MIVRITKGSRYSVSIITDDVLRTYDYIDSVEIEDLRDFGIELPKDGKEFTIYIEAWVVLVEEMDGKRVVKVF